MFNHFKNLGKRGFSTITAEAFSQTENFQTILKFSPIIGAIGVISGGIGGAIVYTVNSKFDPLNEKVDKGFKDINDKMDRRFDHTDIMMNLKFELTDFKIDKIDEKIDKMGKKMDKIDEKLNKLLNKPTRWF
jgi:hypothetical protein